MTLLQVWQNPYNHPLSNHLKWWTSGPLLSLCWQSRYWPPCWNEVFSTKSPNGPVFQSSSASVVRWKPWSGRMSFGPWSIIFAVSCRGPGTSASVHENSQKGDIGPLSHTFIFYTVLFPGVSNTLNLWYSVHFPDPRSSLLPRLQNPPSLWNVLQFPKEFPLRYQKNRLNISWEANEMKMTAAIFVDQKWANI